MFWGLLVYPCFGNNHFDNITKLLSPIISSPHPRCLFKVSCVFKNRENPDHLRRWAALLLVSPWPVTQSKHPIGWELSPYEAVEPRWRTLSGWVSLGWVANAIIATAPWLTPDWSVGHCILLHNPASFLLPSILHPYFTDQFHLKCTVVECWPLA